MTRFERKLLVDRLAEPEVSDGATFGVIGVGALIFGAVLSIPALPIAVGAVAVIAGPTLVIIGFGGTTLMVTRNIIKRKSLNKRA